MILAQPQMRVVAQPAALLALKPRGVNVGHESPENEKATVSVALW
jgi:hypothetical protein